MTPPGDAAFDHPGNVLGAVALGLVDRIDEAAAAAADQSASAAAALSALHFILDAPTIETLRQVLGLTHSGAVRLVDRLEDAGYVTRGVATDARATTVSLTRVGERVARRIATARGAVLGHALRVLTPAERRTFDALVGKIAVGMMREPGAVRWTCRLCDTAVCGRYRGGCPVGNAAIERYGLEGA
jgi:DNA-binding MarR family transcriptional regulator